MMPNASQHINEDVIDIPPHVEYKVLLDVLTTVIETRNAVQQL